MNKPKGHCTGETHEPHLGIESLQTHRSSRKLTEQLHSEGDIRSKYEHELQFIEHLLKTSTEKTEIAPCFEALVRDIQEFSGCEAIGIRILDDNGNIPYQAHTGFSDEFYESESLLSIENDECMCINVVKGDTDSQLRFYTEFGSFYMNGTTRYLATVSEEEKGQTRNKCNTEGYESVALVPIRKQETILGLIHIADTHEGMVPLELVEVLERAGMLIGPLIQRIRDADSLKEQEQKYHTVADFTYDWEYWVDPEGSFAYVSPSCERITGYLPQEFMRDPNLLARITHPDDHELVASHEQNASKTDGPCSLDFCIIDRFGEKRWIGHCCQAVYSKEGEYLGRRGSNRDITKRKEIEKKLEEHRAELAHAWRVSTMGEMASGLAHELNQPLCAILNYASACARIMKGQADESGKIVDALQKISSQADRAGQIIRRLRKLVVKGKPRQSTVCISDTIEEVLNIESAEAQDKSITIHRELAEDLPLVIADPIQIEQVILNLVRNAFDAMDDTKPGMRRITIRTSLAQGNLIEVAVNDTGVGLSSEMEEKAFFPFFTTKTNGLGVGLSLSRSIIEAHGGKLWAESNQDGGATFLFTLPVGRQEEENADNGA